MKKTGELLLGRLRSNAKETFAYSISNLKNAEKESLRKALNELNQVLSEISTK